MRVFRSVNKQADCLFIGGAGLIEDGPKYATGWKLPFNDQILREINIPIIVFAVGLNFHRGQGDLSKTAFKNLCLLIKKSAYFSVRNDGSYEKLKGLFNRYNGDKSLFAKVKEIPDAGLIFNPNEQNKRLPRLSPEHCRKIFNPTWSPKPELRNNSRRLHLLYTNTPVRARIAEQYYFFPHTRKDYCKQITKFGFHSDFKEFIDTSNLGQSLSHYDYFDLMFGLHAHAQLICIGKNIPCISYSSVDKIADFVKKHDLEEFNIEPEGKNKKEIAKEFLDMDDKFTHDASFLKSWYEKRDGLVVKFYEQYGDAVEEVCNILK